MLLKLRTFLPKLATFLILSNVTNVVATKSFVNDGKTSLLLKDGQSTTILRGSSSAARELQTLPTPPSPWTNPPSNNWVPETGSNCHQSGLKVNLTSLNSKTEVGCAAAETNTDDLIESIMIMNPDGVQFSIFAGYAEKSVGECTEYPAPYSYVENKNKITSTTATTAGLYNIDCPKVAYQKCCFIVKCLSANCGSKMTIWSRIYDEAVIREPITGLSDGAKAGLAIFGIFCVLMAISIFLHTTNIFRFYCFDCCAEACCHEKKPKRRGGGASSSYSVPSYPVMINPSSSSYTPQSSSGYPKTTLSSAGYGAKSASGRDLTADRSKVAGASTLTGKMGSAVGKSASNLTSPASPSPSPAPASASKSSKSLTAKSPRYDDNFDDRPRRR